jgi:hypothetical protein
MDRERIYQDPGGTTTPNAPGGGLATSRDYRREAADGDESLAESLIGLAALYSPADVANRGAQ